MKQKRYWLRAIGVGLSVFFTGMAAYTGVPTTLDQLWGPFIQGVLATFTALGLNIRTASKT